MMQVNSSIVAPFRTIQLACRSSANMKKQLSISKRFFQSSTSLLDKQNQQQRNSNATTTTSSNLVTPSSSSSAAASRHQRDMSPNSGRRHLEALTSAVHAKTNLMAASYSSKRQQHSKSSLFVAPDGSSSSSSNSSSFIKFEPTNESMLPKQPLPDLNASLTRYLNSLRPLLLAGQEHDKLQYTEDCVRRFLDPSSANNGHVLQDILYQRAMSRDNWALEKNLDQYLMDTSNYLPIHANPAKVMKPLKFADENAYLSYVTGLMKAIHSFKVKIDTDTLELDRCNAYSKGQPMCMEQYKNIFSSYRLPGVERDCFRVYNDDLANQFVIVMSRGQLFKVNLIVNSKMVDDLELFHQLKEIRRSAAANEKPEQELGYLTSLPRCEWAPVRQEMRKNPLNARSLDLIERSSFMICLDEKVESDEFQNDDVKCGLQLLHGSGIKYNSRNRWHEKTLQFVVSEDGVNGLVREHSPSEGPITVNLINHVYKFLKSSKFSFDSSETYPYSEPERLEWSITDELADKVSQARQHFDTEINNFDLTIFNYDKFGRSYPKLFNMSPDSFLQMVYQLAYFRMYGRLPVQASIGSQRRFFRGRADYYRSPSIDSLKFCLAMTSPSTSVSERFYLFERAVETQTRNMVDTILGNGFDCHLLTLKKIAAELNSELPAIFKDPSFEFNSSFQLLTSQVTTVDDGTFSCFSPTHKIGYGSSYNFKPNNILFGLSSYKCAKSNSISSFADSLVDSLDQVYEICQPRFITHHNKSTSSSNERKN